MIHQLTVTLSNTPGSLAAMVSALSSAEVDIKALGVSDRADGEHGEASLIVSHLDDATAALDASGHTYSRVRVIAVEMDDRVGGLASILALLAKHEINIQQLYAFVSRHTSKALAVVRVDDSDRAVTLLTEGGFAVVSRATIEKGATTPEAPTALGEHLGLDFIW